MELSFSHTNEEVDRLIDRLINATEGIKRPELIRELIISSLKIGQENDYLPDLKMINRTLREMRYTTRVFGPYRNRKKVTIFGSARTKPEEPIYQKCIRFSRLLAAQGWMTITGGGPGIMQAGNEGSGAENTFAVNIRLPFEQKPNPFMDKNPRLITYKYFFNRKVAFVKEADAVAVFPGGFGTLDEAMEVFTLVQTGKTSPKPLVLVDDEEGFWEQFFDFVKEQLLIKGLISGEDFSIFTITKDEQEAAAVIETFYKNYHSVRFHDELAIIRLNRPLAPEQVHTLEEEFPELLQEGGHISCCGPVEVEADEPELAQLPRLVFPFNRFHYGLLIAFINRINTF
ncbi:LOG family protein [Trichlorobacter ammonificans]|uniref:AMP nucleosidase n=1 Tax=Trichlorobacter ammonificans TaxID=2916410 RepID=A0ABM9D4A0_9BACT|nr:TIGR00730 family Rossman fold protein [Trichlorobacter ammonificans]CAH2030066.1 AMP nucleosidase [Trichlorobacter ammonificans]